MVENSADHTKTIILHKELIQAPAKTAGGKFHWNQIASQHYVSQYKVMYNSRTKACVQVEASVVLSYHLLTPQKSSCPIKAILEIFKKNQISQKWS